MKYFVLVALVSAASPAYSLCMKDYAPCASTCLGKLDGKSCVGSQVLLAEVNSCVASSECLDADKKSIEKRLAILCPTPAHMTAPPEAGPTHPDLKARSWSGGPPWASTWTGTGPWPTDGPWSGMGPGGWGPGMGGPFGGGWGPWGSSGPWTAGPWTSWWDNSACPGATWSGWTSGPWTSGAPWTSWTGCTASTTATSTYLTTTTGGLTITTTGYGIKVAENTASAAGSTTGTSTVSGATSSTTPSAGNFLRPDLLMVTVIGVGLTVLNQIL